MDYELVGGSVELDRWAERLTGYNRGTVAQVDGEWAQVVTPDGEAWWLRESRINEGIDA